MASLDMEAYKDFVLKLKIKALDGTSQIRRVRLPRISDQEGNISYQELVGLVVTFTFPSAGSPENFTCSLTYFDEDEDTITIATTDELVDAVEQFADKKTLRITTEVKPIKQATPLKAPQPASSDGASSNRTDRGTSTAEPPIQPNLQNVLESFVGVLASAVNSLEQGLAAPPSTQGSRQNPQAGSKKSPPPVASVIINPDASIKKEESSKKEEAPKAEPVAQQAPAAEELIIGDAGSSKFVKAFVHSRHTCDSCLRTPILGKRYHAVDLPDFDLCESCFKNYSGKETKWQEFPSNKRVDRIQFKTEPNANKLERFSRMSGNKPAAIAPEPQVAAAKNEPSAPPPAADVKPAPSTPAADVKPAPSTPVTEEESLPFIHGRHTCDMCLRTPIVGKRFNATNIKDYDLCENCHGNYCGTEIQFEPVELQRDRAFQKRWHRRRNKLETMKARQNRRRCNRPRPPAPTASPPPPPPTAPGHVEPPIVSPQPQPSQVIPIQTSAPQTSAPPESIDEYDGALKEAIRRSLQDIQPMDDPKPSEEEIAVAPEHNDETPKEDIYADAVEENNEIPPVATLDSKPSPVPSAPKDDDIDAEEKPSPVPSAPKDDDVDAEEKFLIEAMENSLMETMSVDSEKMASFDDEDEKPAAVDRETSTPDRKPAAVDREISDASPKSEMDESFALDAVGNGDIAEAMGATLDAVAGVISEMLADADSHNNQKPSEETTELEEQPTIVSAVESEEENDKEGALILTSEDNVAEVIDDDDDDWSVVEGDNEIAQATQMLGSALFNSDMRSSVENVENENSENVSALTHSDCFSSATSVPSTVPSIAVGLDGSSVSPTQRARWASQLEKLNELGFYDESLCVETLERLQAAALGCNEQDEISITQVVNAILEQN